ncbi:MAG: glutamine synthetase, partial [Pseudomonadota bacterium]
MQPQSISSWLKEHHIEEVECLIPDMTGNARGKLIPASKFTKQESRMPESILLQGVNGVWSEEHDELVMNTVDGDMLLRPDPGAIRIVPWAKPEEPTAQIIHDCYTNDGALHPLATRSVLKRVLKLYADEGWRPILAPEAEFYFVEKNTDPDSELHPPIGRNGRMERAGQSYSIDAINQYEDVIEDMYDYCEAMALDVDTLIHEEGAAQFEVNFLHGEPLDLADQVFTFKRTVREVA